MATSFSLQTTSPLISKLKRSPNSFKDWQAAYDTAEGVQTSGYEQMELTCIYLLVRRNYLVVQSPAKLQTDARTAWCPPLQRLAARCSNLDRELYDCTLPAQ